MAQTKNAPKPPATSITVGAEVFPIRAPKTFAAREDVVGVWSEAGDSTVRSRRCFGFAIGVCVPEVAQAARVRFDGSDPWAFGAAVYNYLREQGLTSDDVIDAAKGCYHVCIMALMPRELEVKRAEVFSAPSAEPPTV